MRLGIDFGTTNSVVVLADGTGATRTLPLAFEGHPPADTCRTLLCLWQEQSGGRLHLRDAIGHAALDAYLDDPGEARLIMSMKSYFGQASFRETRLFGHSVTLEALVARFLAALTRAAGIDPAVVAAMVGRPVRFAGDAPDDAPGAERLLAAFTQAGFRHVTLALEPEAAGWRFMQRLLGPATILVGDFGGGTSDFSVLRFEPGAERPVRALGQAGVGIAGDQFDRRIIDRVVAPVLGCDSTYRIMGGQPLPVPAEWYSSLSRWHRLSLMRAPATLRSIREVMRTASAPDALAELLSLVEDQQGHSLYGAVGQAKTMLSAALSATFRFRHRTLSIEREIGRSEFEDWIAPDLKRIDVTIAASLAASGVGEAAIDQVFLTGGTSLVPAVRQLFIRRFGEARIAAGGEFVSVAEGLALMEPGAGPKDPD